jgi:hypothetical protein
VVKNAVTTAEGSCGLYGRAEGAGLKAPSPNESGLTAPGMTAPDAGADAADVPEPCVDAEDAEAAEDRGVGASAGAAMPGIAA